MILFQGYYIYSTSRRKKCSSQILGLIFNLTFYYFKRNKIIALIVNLIYLFGLIELLILLIFF